MKLLFLSDNFPPESNAPASRTYEHCKEWAKEGVDVTVITCNPNFPYGKVYKGYRNKLYQTEIIDGIKVIRVWSYMTENKGVFKRIVDYFSFAISALFAGLFVKTDLIVATSPQLFTALGGCALAKVKRKPWVFELRDLWPEGIKDAGAIKKKCLLNFLTKMELCLYRKATHIITVTKGLKENLTSRGIDADKIDIVTNGANLDLFKPRTKNKEILKSLCLENKFIFGYIGTHGMAHGLEFIIDSIKEIKDEGVHFLFIGTGAKKEATVALAKKLELKNVTFLDPVEKSKVAEYISIIDVAMIPLTKTDIHASLIPSKIFESASMQKPILLGVEGEAREIVEKYNAGIFFEPENKKEFLEGVARISSDKELYNKLIEGCSKLAEEFGRKQLAAKMLTILKNLNQNIKILLLDGDTVQVLPIAKSLRKKGYHVTIFCESKLSYGWASRFPNKKILSPSPSKEPKVYFEFLETHLKENSYDVVIPLFDDTAGILGENKDKLIPYAKIAVPDYHIFIQGHDKNLTMKVAKKINVPHPKTIDLEENSLEDAVEYCGLPSLIKPNIGAGAKGITRVDTLDELKSLYPKIRSKFGPSTLQEFIPQTGNQFKCQIFRDRDGAIKGATTFIKHRYFPISGGTTSCGEIVDIPELIDYSKQVAEEIGWIGYADFDFIQDPRDNQYKLMEINARITGSVRAGMVSGVDYANMIVQLELGKDVTAYQSTSGLVMRQMALDVMWFLYSSNQERFSAKPNWFKFYGKNIRYQDGEWSDPLPMLAGFLAGARKLLNPSFRKSKFTFSDKSRDN